MRELFKRWQVLLLLAVLAFSFVGLLLNGLDFGVEFNGGTIFQIQLDEKVSPDKMGTITKIIEARLNGIGLKDTKVVPFGDDLVSAQIAETDPKRIEQLETLLKTQGKFEATLDGGLLFEGSDIVQVIKDPGRGYGVHPSEGAKTYGWVMPFILNDKAAYNFSKKVFHRCTATGFDPKKGAQYDCDSTFFFIDRPEGAVIVMPESVYSDDVALLQAGNSLRSIPRGTSIELLLRNADVNYVFIDANGFSTEQLASLSGLSKTSKTAVVHDSVPESARAKLSEMGFKVTEAKEQDKGTPWIWTAVGARQVISITAGIANLDPYVEDPKDARIFSDLLIQGTGQTADEARADLKNLEVLLITGSLPIGIKNISKESVSPLLGREFLGNTFVIGIIALALVALVIFIRYRHPKVALPIMVTCLSEIVIILGFVAWSRFQLDLGSVTGILASVGTGVDHQIIIMDELLRRKSGEEENIADVSYSMRIKNAFFIIMAAAATAIVTMMPVFFGFSIGKLKGFALITVLGVLIGVLITRPAFSQYAEYMLRQEQKAGK
ncbi:Protein-export membrane protein SecD [uncultured archaeon]|nr:Protein-export membrane protein SecD [uncultured archaeon]